MDRSSYKNLIIIIILTLVASLLPEIIFREIIGSVPEGLYLARLIILVLAGVISYSFKQEKITNYLIVLSIIVSSEILTRMIYFSNFWQSTFDMNSFIGNFGASISLKVIGTIPVVVILIVLFKSFKAVYLVKGNLSSKSDEIKWLGIKKDSISWGKLAIISSILISFGTILLVIVTVTGSSVSLNMDNLVKYFPIAVIFALINSLCEGIVFRSAILGSLKSTLAKNQSIYIAALIFGIGHYYGAPSGILGVAMSGLLGWYMSKSMFETEGFVSSWIIHFMQDLVIFCTILLMGNFY